MAGANKEKTEQKDATSPYIEKPSQSSSKLPVRPSQQTRRPNRVKVTASRSELESRIWEIEAEMSHEFATMRSELGSQLAEVRDDISEPGDSLEDSVSGLKGEVRLYVSRLNRYLVFSAIIGLAGLVYLTWQIFG